MRLIRATLLVAGELAAVLVLAAGCGSPGALDSPPKYTVVGSQGVMFFAVVPEVEAENRLAFERSAKRICGTRQICAVKFWLNKNDAAFKLPMTDRQVNSIHAAYNINRNSGLDGFTCHPFGGPGDRCADI